MIQNILAVTGAITQTAQQFDQLGVNTVDTSLDDRTFALLLDGCIHLAASLFNHFFNARRMDTAVCNEFFQCNTGDLATHRFKA